MRETVGKVRNGGTGRERQGALSEIKEHREKCGSMERNGRGGIAGEKM